MKKYLLWHGRMNRKPYVFLSLLTFIVFYIVKVLDPYVYPSLYIVTNVLMYLKFVWNAQRLHDINRTGVWTFITIPFILATQAGPFMTVIGWIANSVFFIYLLVAKGIEGENQYGPDPTVTTFQLVKESEEEA